MKRAILAGTTLALTCLACSFSIVWAQQPGTIMKEFVIESTESELCSSLRAQLAGSEKDCLLQVRKDLATRGFKNSRRVPDLTRVLIEVKADSSNFTVQDNPVPASGPATTPLDRLDLQKLDTRIIVAVDAARDEILKEIEAGQTDTSNQLKTLADKPAGASFGTDLTWVYAGLGGLALLVTMFGLFSVLAKQSSKKHDANHKETGDAFRPPPIKSEDARRAAETLLAGIATSETTIERLTNDLKATGDDAKAQRERAGEAEKRATDLSGKLEAALKDGKLSAKEITDLRTELDEAKKEAAERIAAAAKKVDAALESSESATAENRAADAHLADARDELVLEGADKK